MIISKTPYRISFFGGGTDLPAWINAGNKGLILSTSFNRYCFVTLRHLPKIFSYRYRLRYYKNESTNHIKDIKHNSIRASLNYLKFHNQSLELVHHGELPAQSGLGSSSTFTVGLLNSLYKMKKIKISKKKLALNAIHIEQKLLNESVGVQDHIAASHGGFNIIAINKNNFTVTPIVNKNLLRYLEKRIILIFTGLQRNSNILEKKKSKIISTGKLNNELSTIYDLTQEALSEIESSNFSLKRFGNLLNESWRVKRKTHNQVSNEIIDEIHQKAISLGAYGGKLMGSGNGGFMMFVGPSNSIIKIKDYYNLNSISDIKFDFKGSHIAYS